MSRALDATPPLRVAGVLAGGLAAAVVIFSLRVMVGRRAAQSSADVAAVLAPLPAESPLVPEPPPLSAPVPAEGLTFYDRLSGRAAPRRSTCRRAPRPRPPALPAKPRGEARRLRFRGRRRRRVPLRRLRTRRLPVLLHPRRRRRRRREPGPRMPSPGCGG